MKKPKQQSKPRTTFKCWVILNHKGAPLDVLLFKPPPPYPAESFRATLTLTGKRKPKEKK